MTRKVDSSGNVCFAGTNYRVGSKYRRRQVQVAVVGDTVEISVGNQLVRSAGRTSERRVARRTGPTRPMRCQASSDPRADRSRVLIVFPHLDALPHERDAIEAESCASQGPSRSSSSTAASYAEWRQMFGEGHPDMLEGVGPEHLPGSFRVTPTVTW